MRVTCREFRLRRGATLLLVVFGLLCFPSRGNAQTETLASEQLQKDTKRMIFQIDGAISPPCKTPRVVKAEVLSWPPDVWKETGRIEMGYWEERWYVDHCGTEMIYKIEYKSNGRGGLDIGVQIPGAGQPDPPLPSTPNAQLLEAAETGNLRLIEKLLLERADPKTANQNGRTPLIAASAHAYTQAVKLLLDKGSEVKTQDNRGRSALFYASGTAGPLLIRMLLTSGADVQQRTHDGEVPLHQAAATGNMEAAKLLLEAGADVNARSDFGQGTPLMEAGTNSRPEMMLFLLEYGADPSLRTTAGATVLTNMGLGCHSPEVVRVMLARGSFTTQDRSTALLKSLRAFFQEDCAALVGVLLESGVDVNQRDEEGNTALMIASWHGSRDIVRTLLDKGAEVSIRNRQGKTALDLASNRQVADLIRKAGKKQ